MSASSEGALSLTFSISIRFAVSYRSYVRRMPALIPVAAPSQIQRS
jgi:hypothetical protein